MMAWRFIVAFFVLLALGVFEAQGGKEEMATARTLTLGVFSYFSQERNGQCCQTMVEQLNASLKDFQIRLLPIDLRDGSQISGLDAQVDFILTNPIHFIELRKRYNLDGAIASVVRQTRMGQPIHHTGGVIFAQRGRADIRELSDIKGKWVAVAGTQHLGGYAAPAYELLQAGVDVNRDIHLIETGDFSFVVDAVLSGSVDVGFVPVGILERLEAEGHLRLEQLKILNAHQQAGFPLLVSTRLYPQWPIVAMPHVASKDIEHFLLALLSLSVTLPEIKDTCINGFAPPADYRSVEAVARALHLPPFHQPLDIPFTEIWRQHSIAISIIGFAIVIIVVLLNLLFIRNRQLRQQRLAAEHSANDFRQIIDATYAGTWKWELATGQLIINERWAEMLGYRLEELRPCTIEDAFRLTHEDDLLKAKQCLYRHLEGDAEYFDTHYRMRHKEGHWVWVHSRGKITHWDLDGTPRWIFGTHTDVTQRMQAELELQKSRAKYQRLIDNIGEKFIIYSHTGTDGVVTYVSDGVEHIFSKPKDAVIGKSWFEAVDWLPQDVEKAKAYMRERADRQTAFMQFEMRFNDVQGHVRTLRISSHAVRDAVGNLVSIDGLAEDITAQKRAHERILMAASVFAHSQESIIITNTLGEIIDCNPAACALSGFSREEIIGSNPKIFSSGTHKPGFYRNMWATLLEGKVWQGSFCNRHKDGHIYWTESSISPIKDENGQITHYVSVSRDITRKKQQIQSLRQAKQDAQAANTAKSVFVANISHEIRTPMNAVLGFTNLCLEHDLPEKPRKYLQNVKASALNMLSLINEILDFSKIEAGKLHIESIPFDLDRELTQVTSMIRQLLKDKPVHLTFHKAYRLKNKLVGDPLRLKQVLTNLASNAAKFTDQGQVSIAVQECLNDGRQVELEFSVCDTGIGMSQTALKTIFQPFSQADSSTTRKFGGTGLGLTISSQLVQKMGGRIRVESEQGIGSTFYFRLRFPISEETCSQTQALTTHSRTYQHLSHTRVLLVEDNEINRELVTEILRKYRLKVDVAENGQQALDKLKDNTYDIVLTDIQMPVMDGFQVTRAIREDLHLRTLPIIALTANAGSTVREKCMRAGMDDYLSKPIDMHKLLEKIDSILNPLLQRINGHAQPLPFSRDEQEQAVREETDGVVFPELVDSKGALQRLGLDADTLVELLKKFASQHRMDMARLRELVATAKWQEAARLAHTQKGLSATIGIESLASKMAELEQKLKALAAEDEQDAQTREMGIQSVEALLEETHALFDAAIAQIDAMQVAQTDELLEPLPVQDSGADLSQELNDLLELVEQYDVTAVSKANELLVHCPNETLREELQNIRDDLENFDFESTSTYLKKLIAEL